MAIYLSQPIIDKVVRFVEEDSRYEDSVKAMAAEFHLLLPYRQWLFSC